MPVPSRHWSSSCAPKPIQFCEEPHTTRSNPRTRITKRVSIRRPENGGLRRGETGESNGGFGTRSRSREEQSVHPNFQLAALTAMILNEKAVNFGIPWFMRILCGDSKVIK